MILDGKENVLKEGKKKEGESGQGRGREFAIAIGFEFGSIP